MFVGSHVWAPGQRLVGRTEVFGTAGILNFEKEGVTALHFPKYEIQPLQLFFKLNAFLLLAWNE